MVLQAYYDLKTQPSRALYIFLKATDIPFESCPVQLQEGEQYTEAFGKLNPFRKVPVINDNGFKLTESVAILRYLARTRKIDDHWYASDVKLQAKVDEYLEWQHLNTRLFCAMYSRHKFIKPMMFQIPVDEQKVAYYQKAMEKCLGEIETIWLDGGKKKFITGDQISIADILACCELEQPGSYRDRVRNATDPHYEEAHKFVRAFTKKFKGVPQINKL